MRDAEDAAARDPGREGGRVDDVHQALLAQAVGEIDEADVLQRAGEGARRHAALDLHQIAHRRARHEGGQEAALQRGEVEQHRLGAARGIGLLGVPLLVHLHVGGGVRLGKDPEREPLALGGRPQQHERERAERKKKQQPDGGRGPEKEGGEAAG